MKTLRSVFAILVFSFSLFTHAQIEESMWFTCAEDSDCIAVKGVCSQLTSINQKYKVAAEKYYKTKQKGESCKGVKKSKDKTKPTVSCVYQMCRIK